MHDDAGRIPSAPPIDDPARGRIRRRAKGAVAAYLLPSFLPVSFIVGYPLLQLSSAAVRHTDRFGHLHEFVGLDNFRHLWDDPVFVGALARTLLWTALVVGPTLALSMLVALILRQSFLGRGFAQMIVLLPWSISLTMTAVVWRRALNGESGLLNVTLKAIGLLGEPIVWLGSPGIAFAMEVLIAILVSIPFCVAILLSGLSAIPADIYEVAIIDGAGAWARFRWLTVPLLRPFLSIAFVFNVAYVSNSLPLIWVMTQGGPANKTDILVTYIYKMAFVLGRLGDAAAASLTVLLILIAFTIGFLHFGFEGYDA